MFLKCNRRFKDGKEHRYWSIVENRRCAGGQVIQRPVLYLGEINDSKRESWCRTIEAFDSQQDLAGRAWRAAQAAGTDTRGWSFLSSAKIRRGNQGEDVTVK